MRAVIAFITVSLLSLPLAGAVPASGTGHPAGAASSAPGDGSGGDALPGGGAEPFAVPGRSDGPTTSVPSDGPTTVVPSEGAPTAGAPTSTGTAEPPAGAPTPTAPADPTGGAVPREAVPAPTAAAADLGAIGVLEELRLVERTLHLSGWTLDPDTDASTSVRVDVGGVSTVVPADLVRHDVDVAFSRGPNHGFAADVPLDVGHHDVCVYGVDESGAGVTLLRCAHVQVGGPPLGVVEAAVSASVTGLRVSGWAFDPDDPRSGSVHVDVDGQSWAVPANGFRGDVGAAYSRDPYVGFTATLPVGAGWHTVCVWAIDSGGAPAVGLGCRDVEVRDTAPVGVLEAVELDGRTVTVSGWAFDPDAAGPTTVHVYVAGSGIVAHASVRRPDVGSAYGRDGSVGFTARGAVPVGTSQVCVYAINTTGPPHPSLGCREVVVRDAPPIGVIEQADFRSQILFVSGWAFDPDSPGPVRVRISTRSGDVTADLERADVAAAYGRDGHVGFAVEDYYAHRDGPLEVCVYALNSWGAPDAFLGCRPVVGRR